VLETHGLNDDNVRPKQFSQWWTQLNVPKKLWLSNEGHVDPFDYRRTQWVDTLHKWFDHWLYGIDNDVMSQPQVDIEREPDQWTTQAGWPAPDTSTVNGYLQAKPGTAGSITLSSGGPADSVSFKDGFTSANSGPSEATQIASPNGSQANRAVFLTAPLKAPLHLSGTPYIDMFASLDKPQSNIGAEIVDYNSTAFTKINPANDGVKTDTTSPKDCVGDSTPTDSACYYRIIKNLQSTTSFRFTRGILDSSNRDSLDTGTPVTPGTEYEFKVEQLPVDYIIPAGHQLGVIIQGNFRSFGLANTLGTTFTIDTKKSTVQLPVTGGQDAAAATSGFVADTTAPTITPAPADMTVNSTDPTGTVVTYPVPTSTDTQDPNPIVNCSTKSGAKFPVGTTTVTCTATDANGNASSTDTFHVTVLFVNQAAGGASGTVPATLSLTLGAPASFGTFTPGIAMDYAASTTATVTSTAGDATLSVSDPDTTNPGHLVNGSFVLPSALQAKATKADTTGSAFNSIGSMLNLLTWSGPASNDAVTLSFLQHISANDALRTGTYSKTLTFTLSTTTP